MRKEGTGERDQSFREHRLRQFLLYLPPEGYTGLVPRFEIDGVEEEEGRTGNDRSGVVKIERADSEPRELWRASERGEARRGEASRREPSWLVENTRIIRALGVGLPAARNMVIAARNPGRRVAGVDGEIPRTRTILVTPETPFT